MVERKVIHTDSAPKALGPYSQAILSGDLLYSAGQVGIDPATGKMVDGGVTAQAKQVLSNLRAVLAAADCSFADVIKTTIFLADMADFAVVNEEYAAVFGDVLPARSTVAVAGLPADARVEIEVIARHSG